MMLSSKNVNRLFLFLVVFFLAASLLLGFVDLSFLPLPLRLMISQALIFVPSFVYCKLRRVKLKEMIPFRRMRPSVWILVVVCTYLMYPLLIVLNAISLFFVESGTADLMDTVSQGGFLMMTLLTALLPAFVEEFVFRGILFSTYKRSKFLPAVFLSALLFGCMHMNFNQFLYAFALGIYLALLVEATGSIFSSMLAHFTINFTSVVMTFALPKLMEAVEQAQEVGLPQEMRQSAGNFLTTMDSTSLLFLIVGLAFWGVIALGTTAGAVGVYIAIARLSKRWDHVKTMTRTGTRERILSIPVFIAVALAFAAMIL